MRQTQNASKKDNRKSILVIGLLLLLVAVIGFGGYTLSKYVTKKTETGSATVAKWGFTIETKNADKLFGDQYKAGGTVAADDDTLIVKADTNNVRNLVAPGTSGSMTFKIAGKAEVLAKVGVEMKAATDKDAIEDVVLKYKKNNVAGTDYAPVKWTLTKTGTTPALVDNGTLAQVQTALKGLYKAKIAIGTEINDEYTLSWAWAFEKADGRDDADQLDTLLGWKANGTNPPEGYEYTIEDGTSTSISFTLEISVVQVKEA